jgi:hypothetical protein
MAAGKEPAKGAFMKSIKPILVASAAAAVALAATVVTVHHASAATSSGSAPSQVAVGPCFDQPNMAAALSQLRGARNSLNNVEHNKGGWRDEAIKHADAAIADTVRGCQFAK